MYLLFVQQYAKHWVRGRERKDYRPHPALAQRIKISVNSSRVDYLPQSPRTRIILTRVKLITANIY